MPWPWRPRETRNRSKMLSKLLRHKADDFKDIHGYVSVDDICVLLPEYCGEIWMEEWTRDDIMMVVATSINDNNERRFQARYTEGQVSHLRALDSTHQRRVVPRPDPYPRITVVPRPDPYPRITPKAQTPPWSTRGLQPGSSTAEAHLTAQGRRPQAAPTVPSRPPPLQTMPEDNRFSNTLVAPKAPPPALPQAPHPRIPKAPPLSSPKAPPPASLPKAPPPASLPKAPPPELSPPPAPRNEATCVFCYERSPTHAFVHAEGTSGDIADLVSHPLICRECLSRAQKKAPTSLARCPVCRVDSLMLIPVIQ